MPAWQAHHLVFFTNKPACFGIRVTEKVKSFFSSVPPRGGVKRIVLGRMRDITAAEARVELTGDLQARWGRVSARVKPGRPVKRRMRWTGPKKQRHNCARNEKWGLPWASGFVSASKLRRAST
jgi:hypothetical protein